MYSNYFLRRPLVRQNIPRRTGYPLGYCGKLGNFPFVVLGIDDDDDHKLPAICNQCNEADKKVEQKKKTQEQYTAGGDELQSLAVRTELSESAGPYAETWQQSACAWDRQQSRYNQFRAYDAQRKGEILPNECEHSTSTKFDLATINYQRPCFKDPLTGKEVRFTKPMVGYGGFVPRYPVLPRPQERCSKPGLISTSKTTYKLYPSYEYKKQEFAHKGPLSGAVTTTPPFNPYNKVEKLNMDGKKLLWKRQNHIIKLVKMEKNLK